MDDETKTPSEARQSWWRRIVLMPNPLPSKPIARVLSSMLRSRKVVVTHAVAAAGLPEQLTEIACQVALKARLWPSEQLDVARELSEHFADGLDAGRAPDALVASFGDVRTAARLITRAKHRTRPLVWHVVQRTALAVAATTLLVATAYLALFLRMKFAQPVIAWNYKAEVMAEAEAIRQEDRAWPLYRDALARLTYAPILDERLTEIGPDSDKWDALVTYLNDHAATIELTRQGAKRRHLGFYYSDPGNAIAIRYENSKNEPRPLFVDNNVDNPWVIAVPLPHLSHMRMLAMLALADARLAAEVNDAERFTADIETVVAMSEQARETFPFLVTDLFSTSMIRFGLQTLHEVLAVHRDLLSDEQLKRLAHRLGGYGDNGRIVLRAEGERAVLRDLWQRLYTDDGRGDGYITWDGMQVAGYDLLENDWQARWSDAKNLLLVPLAATTASRRELTRATDEIVNLLGADLRRNLWEHRSGRLQSRAAIDRLPRGGITGIGPYWPLITMFPSVEAAYLSAETTNQRIGVLLVVMAIELYHRSHGAWPDRLDDLVPSLLPAVPPDRFSGQPIKYRLIDGRPVLYSVGPNLTDEGGDPRAETNSREFLLKAPSDEKDGPLFEMFEQPIGDWILWEGPARNDE